MHKSYSKSQKSAVCLHYFPGCILENNADNASREPDRESASITAVAGPSLTGSVASSYLGGPSKSKTNRLEVGVDVHPRKKFSFSSERLSETVSLSERSATVSLADDGGNSVASTRALAGSLLAYKVSFFNYFRKSQYYLHITNLFVL